MQRLHDKEKNRDNNFAPQVGSKKVKIYYTLLDQVCIKVYPKVIIHLHKTFFIPVTTCLIYNKHTKHELGLISSNIAKKFCFVC